MFDINNIKVSFGDTFFVSNPLIFKNATDGFLKKVSGNFDEKTVQTYTDRKESRM